METVTYRCAVDPDGCGDFAAPGFCHRHRLHPLRAVETVVDAAAGETPSASEDDGGASFERAEVRVTLLGLTVPVPAEGVLIGRQQGPFAELPGIDQFDQISRQHATIYWIGDRLYVRDCGSLNGTFVDGEKVDTPRRILPGQHLRLGLDVPVTIQGDDLDEFGLPR